MDLETAALAAEQRGGAVLLQQGGGGSRGAVLLPEGEADLRDQGPGPSQTNTGSLRHLRGTGRLGEVIRRQDTVICFVFRL